MDLHLLSQLTNKAIRSAGPRYTPGRDKDAPNLHIEALEDAFAGLVVSPGFAKILQQIVRRLKHQWSIASKEMRDSSSVSSRAKQLSDALIKLSKLPPTRGRSKLNRASQAAAQIEKMIDDEQNHIRELNKQREKELREHAPSDDPPHRTQRPSDTKIRLLEEKSSRLREFEFAIADCRRFLTSDQMSLRFTNRALLIGSWGSGKTHFLCDYARLTLADGLPACVVLARDLPAGSDPLEIIARLFNCAHIDQVLDGLANLGRQCRRRALLLLDGINEGDQATWRKAIPQLIRGVRSRPNLGLIVSSRTPMHELILTEFARKNLVEINHPGFEEIEFDAQKEFFRFYKVPLPEIPLLAEEFSRPLTLKILCEHFSTLSVRQRKKGFEGIASGQKGMTFVLERYVIDRTKSLEMEFSLPAKFFWRLIKGDNAIKNPRLAGIAPYIAATGEQEVPNPQVYKMLMSRPQAAGRQLAKTLLARLAQEGVVFEHHR